MVFAKCNELYDGIIHSPMDEKLDRKCDECNSKSISNGIANQRNVHRVKIELLKRMMRFCNNG